MRLFNTELMVNDIFLMRLCVCFFVMFGVSTGTKSSLFVGRVGGVEETGADNLFSTHPSTQNRVEALASKFGGRAAATQPELVSPRRNRPKGPWDKAQDGDRKPGPWG